MDRQPLIKLSRISGGYEGKIVLRNVNLEIYPNDFLGIIGPNGGGKTTLIKMILGLLKPASGDIAYSLQGKRTNEISIGYLPQYNTIDKKFPISVYEVVLSGLNKQKSLFRPFTTEQHAQVQRTIARMGLQGLEKRAIGQLSGGQMQRALLGRALVSNPQAIILDEPDTYIDKQFAQKLYALLEEINRECAIILVSHDIATVLHHAKSIAFVNGTLHYHPDTQVSQEWLEEHLTSV
ncbi:MULTISPECIES: metal ABC transporter ATP-binding protein [Bacteroides]|uniref:Metal ABC transporter ATP-binding protein n=1 Tax=Bacteroides gallinaceum TaxID=1462571 RepID=A0ABT7VHI6_9BACE|nr:MULTISPECIES: metal ABC transporter ATP-binding protein [Bacteroides]MCR8917279.1 metal ABC transporter ATP-binding protein [Bacteroides sp. ET225]MDM8207766.1 metal ABC transporter ATP-binding protein [Bacteroides gallinaceum]MDM8325767.1 metal ABC transporter ATP-binding protein [Bacteroides gallinaceum]